MHKRIDIAERLSPFSHQPGTWVNLPRINIQAELFPCLLRLYDVREAYPLLIKELFLDFGASVSRFSVFHRLEKGVIDVEGIAADELFRYELVISPNTTGVQLVVNRSPKKGLVVQHGGEQTVLHRGSSFNLHGNSEEFEKYQPPLFERLSLGNHKRQDWDFIQRRLDLKEIFPIWLRLGQMAPKVSSPSAMIGTFTLLKHCEEHLSIKGCERTELPWINLFRAAFHGIMVPRIDDDDHQGFFSPPSVCPEGVNTIFLLTEGARLIRQLFIDDRSSKGGALMILPHLLPSFTCGRYINIALGEWGVIDMEWSKRKIRRLLIKAKKEMELSLHFGSNVREYRLQDSISKQSRGEWRSCEKSLLLVPNTDYLLDNFN